MTRREMLERMGFLGAGLMAAPLAGKAFGQTTRRPPAPGTMPEAEEILDYVRSLPKPRRQLEALESLGYVVVTPHGPKDGGHFGSATPGTGTSGLQEAFEYAKKNSMDVYIVGGGFQGTFQPRTIYSLHETLHIPWMQNARVEGGEAVLYYNRKRGDAVLIDSQMNCWMKFGLIVTRSDGAAVHMKPETQGPDGFSVIAPNVFEFNVCVGGGTVWQKPQWVQKGIGLWLDGSTASVHSNKIFLIEVVAAETGILMTGQCGNNWIQVPFLHLCRTGIQIGSAESPNVNNNRIEASMLQGMGEKVGVRIFGQGNLLTLNVAEMAPGKDVVFEAPARDNLVIAHYLPAGITNNATSPTNRVMTLRPVGFDVPSPPFPASGEDAVNRNPYSVQVIFLAPGQVSEWTLTDAGGRSRTVSGGLMAGQSLILDPGERIRFSYAAVPSWTWKALA